jgi:hypothetical protein
VLEPDGHLKPRVSSALVERYGRWREGRLPEGTDRDANNALATLSGLVDRRATLSKEAKGKLCSFVSETDVFSTLAGDLEPRLVETRLHTEDAAGTLLASQAMAYIRSKRLTLHFSLKLPAGARSNA